MDADVSTYFVGKRYHIDLVLHRDDLKEGGNCASDHLRWRSGHGSLVHARHSPRRGPGFRLRWLEDGDGLSRPWNGVFPWDVAQLPRNIWYPERLIQGNARGTSGCGAMLEGDLVATHRLGGGDWIRIECPQRFGYNISRLQHFNEGQDAPALEVRIEWKQGLERRGVRPIRG